MAEELLKEEEYKDFILKVCWGRPAVLNEYDKDICSVYVRQKSSGDIIFTERTSISDFAILEGKEDPKEKLINDTINRAKNRIKENTYKEGETYNEEITK